MTISESLYFVYDGIRSDEMGLINVNMQSGMQEDLFMPEQSIKEVTIRGNDTPYFIETERRPFTLNLTFAFEDTFNDEKIQTIENWLGNKTFYKPLYFSDNLEKWYYVLYTGESTLLHNCLKQGYVQIQMRSISPYTYSPIYESNIYDLTTNTTEGTEIVINNSRNLICKPTILLYKIGNGEISIRNDSDRGKTFRIINLFNDESIVIDSSKEDIISDIPLTFHFDDYFGEFPVFVPGANYLRVFGNCKIKFKYQYINNG
ncbi:phage tail domain-containing protein [Paenibacillus lautus]|uniref:phage tail domain-containing protein n=1 Tax=Paenibacillus lautus TaxID=1401 RepID=UPI001C7E0F41|nr:phage tail domain-containing protein [Paenibacillus lautus]MBX4147498.1 phage tail family protein [Paenibacillus lautus]